jgi:CNT family concentrative nucleoside transporter
MTYSELNAVMVGGFATIAGGVLAAYVAMGIDAGHLVTASVISAPAALLIAKVMVPETQTPATLGADTTVAAKRCVNVIEAAADGAVDGLKLALNVGAMLLVFTALIAMCDAVIGWIGGVFGYLGPDGQYRWSLGGGLGYLFTPLAWVMGIPWEDCQQAGELLGLKTVLNEFFAYDRLAQVTDPLPGALAALQSDQVHAAALASLSPTGNASLAMQPTVAAGGLDRVLRAAAAEHVSDRTRTILTYALCGFANFASIGIQLGGIGGIAPERRSDLAKLGLRAMIGGTLAAFMTACVAGILLAD